MAKTKVRKRQRRKRCRWCNQFLDHRKHRNKTESLCFVQNEREIRSNHRPKVKSIREVYTKDGRLKSEFIGTDMETILLKRQHRLALNATLGLDCPKNVGHILEQEFVHGQISHEKTWAVMWLSKGERKRKRFNSLWSAVEFWNKAHRINKTASIVSLARGYELPAEWRFKKDRLGKKWKWCPYCVTFRVYKKVPGDGKSNRFYAMVKYQTVDKKGKPCFDWAERKLWLTACPLCGNTNRNPIFRRANQPYELRKIKQGARRIKPRKNAPKSKTRRKRL